MARKVLIITLAVVLALALLAGPALSADKVYKWKGQTAFGLATPLSKHNNRPVEEIRGGNVRRAHGDHPPRCRGDRAPHPRSTTRSRTACWDFGLNTPAFQKGTYPAGDLFFTLPGGLLEFNDLLLWLYSGGGKELEQEMYGNKLIVFPLGLTPPEEIWSKRPIKTLADIKGLKIRAAGLSMDLFGKLGASVVLLPGGEVMPGLQRGLIDATEMLEPSFDYTMGLHEVCKYRFGPPIHMSNSLLQLLIKTKSWEELPNDLKAIVEKAAQAATLQGYTDFWQASIEYNTKIEKYGTITTKLPKEEQLKTREIAYEILNEKSAKDPFFKKVWESQKAFLKAYKPYYDLTKFD